MPLVAPNAAEQVLLQYLVGLTQNNQYGTGQILHLYGSTTLGIGDVGSGTIPQTATLGMFTSYELGTAPWSIPSYTASFLTYTSWAVNLGTDSYYTATYSPASVNVTFTLGSACYVYGYYVTSCAVSGLHDNTGNLLWCERFLGAPFVMPSGGGTIAVQPKLTLN